LRVSRIVTRSAEETIQAGRELARQIQPPLLVLLSGELGSGKTTLAKGIISGLGAAREEDVTSPTFTLVHEFAGPCKVFHIDLYRIEGAADLESLGLEDLFASPAIVLVEWPEKWRLSTDWPVRRIRLAALDDGRHSIELAGL
jgi:tRNA threonylcarbamoyladenosine biosynthesis protein TsaE